MSVLDWVSGRVFKFVHGNNLVYNTCWEDPRLDRVEDRDQEVAPGAGVVPALGEVAVGPRVACATVPAAARRSEDAVHRRPLRR